MKEDLHVQFFFLLFLLNKIKMGPWIRWNKRDTVNFA